MHHCDIRGKTYLPAHADASLKQMVTKFSDLDALSLALAEQIATAVSAGIAARGSASLIVSGGKSPQKLFEHLRARELDWSRVSIALADERWVEPSDPSSNEKLVRDVLLKDHAAAAKFIGLKNASPTPDMGAVAAWETFARVPRPFDMVILGMGDDGHTASLFADSPGLGVALDVQQPPGCVGMLAPQPPRARISLNLSALLNARRIGLLILGPGKWATYERACGAGAVEAMPVRALLRQQQVPVAVYWAP
jgi:6-phosphogluconolactonase